MVHHWRRRRLRLALTLAASTALGAGTLYLPRTAHALSRAPTPASTYSCGGPVFGHCYGITEWTRPSSGSSVTISTVALNGGDGFVTNEMWLFGDPPPNLICPNGQDPHGNGTCWVEAGAIAGYVGALGYYSDPVYFWADERPSAPGTMDNFNAHVLGYVPTQDLNHGATFRILQAHDGTGHYGIQVFNKDCLLVPDYTDVSTQDQLVPTGIDIGAEVYGSSGASAPPAEYTDNQFQDNNGWHYEIDGGDDLSGGNGSAAVPHRWDRVPTPDGYLPVSGPGQTYRGGDWYTRFP